MVANDTAPIKNVRGNISSMTPPLPTQARFTIQEYYELEDAAEYKSEFVDGQIIAMSGGTEDSSTIEMNLARELSTRLRGAPCRPHGSSLKVRIKRSVRCRYSNALVISH